MRTDGYGTSDRRDSPDTALERYDAFISYSHAADGKLAPALQSALQRFTKPWYRRRALRVFRDKTSLSATPELWPTIEKALATSRVFVLLASPEAARSPWVQREVGWWIEHRSRQTLLIILTDGVLTWDESTRDLRHEPNGALPPNLQRVFESEPLWVDLRWARQEAHLSQKDPRFQDAVADLAAPIHGRAKEDLVGEDVREYRRTMRLAQGAGTTLALLTILFAASAVFAWSQRNEALLQTEFALVQTERAQAEAQVRSTAEANAVAERDRAEQQVQRTLARQLAAQAQVESENLPVRSVLLAAQAARLARAVPDGPLATAEQALRRTLSVIGGVPLPGPPLVAGSLSFSPSGRVLAAVGTDQTVLVWTLSQPDPLGGPLPQPIVLRTNGPAWDLIVSPDDRQLAVYEPDLSQVRLWSLETTPPQVRVIPTGQIGVHGRAGTRIAFSADSRWLIVGPYVPFLHSEVPSKAPGEPPTIVQFWDLADPSSIGSGQPLVLRPEGEAPVLAVSPDRPYLAISTTDRVRIWEISALPAGLAAPVAEYPFEPQRYGGNSGVGDGRFMELISWSSSDGAHMRPLLVMHRGGDLPDLWDLTDPQHAVPYLCGGLVADPSLFGPPRSPSPDVPVPVSPPACGDGRPVQPFRGTYPAMERSDRALILLKSSGATAPDTLHTWQFLTPSQKRGQRIVESVALDTGTHLKVGWTAVGGPWVAFGGGTGGGTVYLYGFVVNRHDQRVVVRGHDGGTTAGAVSPDGHWLVTTGRDSVVRLWPLSNPAADRTTIRSARGDNYFLNTDTGTVYTEGWAGHATLTESRDFGNPPDAGQRYRWSSDNPLVAAPTPSPAVKTRDVERLIDSEEFESMTFRDATSDGRWWVLIDRVRRRLGIWDSASPGTGPKVVPFPLAANAPVNAIGSYVSPDGHTFVAWLTDPDSRLAQASSDRWWFWDPDHPGAPRSRPLPADALVENVTISRDGAWLVSATTRGLFVWDVARPEDPPRPLYEGMDSTRVLGFSPDGQWLAAVVLDSLRVWSVADWSKPPLELGRVTGEPNRLAFSPDSRRIAVDSRAREAQVWTLGGSEAVTLADTEDPTSRGGSFGLMWSADGRWLASLAGGVGVTPSYVRVWPMDIDELVARACAIAGRDLRPDEWSPIVPDRYYTPVCSTLVDQPHGTP